MSGGQQSDLVVRTSLTAEQAIAALGETGLRHTGTSGMAATLTNDTTEALVTVAGGGFVIVEVARRAGAAASGTGHTDTVHAAGAALRAADPSAVFVGAPLATAEHAVVSDVDAGPPTEPVPAAVPAAPKPEVPPTMVRPPDQPAPNVAYVPPPPAQPPPPPQYAPPGYGTPAYGAPAYAAPAYAAAPPYAQQYAESPAPVATSLGIGGAVCAGVVGLIAFLTWLAIDNEPSEFVVTWLIPTAMFQLEADTVRVEMIAIVIAAAATVVLALLRNGASIVVGAITGIGALAAVAHAVLYASSEVSSDVIPYLVAPVDYYGFYIYAGAAMALIALAITARSSLNAKATAVLVAAALLAAIALASNYAADGTSYTGMSAPRVECVTAAMPACGS